MSANDIIRVDEWKMREMFNEAGFYERTKTSEIEAKITRNKHPNWIAAWLPFCTYSQEVSYRHNGQEVARVHQYLKPDGMLGASGLPDPKRLQIGDVKYRLITKPGVEIPWWHQWLRRIFWWCVNRVLAWSLALSR